MPTPLLPCPGCGRELVARPGQWTRCPWCYVLVLRSTEPAGEAALCAVCGEAEASRREFCRWCVALNFAESLDWRWEEERQ